MDSNTQATNDEVVRKKIKQARPIQLNCCGLGKVGLIPKSELNALIDERTSCASCSEAR